MIYKIKDIRLLTVGEIKKYYSMLSQQRRDKITNTQSPEKRTVMLCGEMLARQCLSELLNLPEASFRLLCNPDSLSVVGNCNACVSIVHSGSYVACAASENKVGIGLAPVKPFSFKDAQGMFSDSEIRSIFSDSVYSFAEIVGRKECNEESIMRKFALFSAIHEAHFRSTGRGIKSALKNVEFIFNGKELVCTDADCRISVCEIDINKQLAVSVVERK